MSPAARILVAGGSGFIGRHLVARLVGEGRDVVVLDNGSSSIPTPGVVVADVTQPLPPLGHFDAIVNLASPASPRDYLSQPIETLLAGSHGTHHLLELAREQGARFVLASTSEIYGDPLVTPQREDYWGNVNPIGPRSVYDEAKRYAEALTTAYTREHAVNTAIARIFNCYGPGMRPDDGRAIPTFIVQALAGDELTVAGDGSQTRSPTYIDDIVDGLVRLIDSDLGGPVNLGTPEQVTVLDLAERIRDLTGSSSGVRHVELPQDDPTNRLPDITRARTELAWAPTVALDAGLRITIDWFRSYLSADR